MKTSDHQDYYARKQRRGNSVAMTAVLLAVAVTGAAVIVNTVAAALGGGL